MEQSGRGSLTLDAEGAPFRVEYLVHVRGRVDGSREVVGWIVAPPSELRHRLALSPRGALTLADDTRLTVRFTPIIGVFTLDDPGAAPRSS